MGEGQIRAFRTFVDATRPDKKLDICEWIERNIVLDGGETSAPGEYRFRRAPYMRAILECLSPDSPVQRATLKKGVQLGGTIAAGAYIGFLIAEAPRPILYVASTLDLAKKASRRKIGPILRDTAVLRAKVREAGSRKAGNTSLLKEFPGGVLLFAGANSGSGLRMASAAVLILDEVDAFPMMVLDEGDPVVLAERATKAFPRRKHLYISTPTVEGRSRIDTLYAQSDRSRYFVPCPRCGFFQTLWLTDPITARHCLRWEGEAPDLDVWYECEKCKGRIDEGDKPAMLEAGVWRAEVPALSQYSRGFAINSIYSAPGTFSWKEIAIQFINTRKDNTKLAAFVNQVLGECWEEPGEAPPWEELFRRREHYKMGTVPAGGAILTAGADVQRDRIEVEIVAWGADLESWSVDYLVILGDTAGEKPWHELDRVLNRSFPTAGGTEIRIRGLAVDSGWETSGVYNWVRRHAQDQVFAVKGSKSIPSLVGAPAYMDFTWRGRKAYRAVRLWHIGTDVAKRELYGWLRMKPPLHPERGERCEPGFIHFPEYDENHFKGLTAEQLVPRPKKRGGGLVYEWVAKYERNEQLDARVYARAAAAILGLDRYSEEDWRKAASALNREGEKPPEPKAPSRARPKREDFFRPWRSRRPS